MRMTARLRAAGIAAGTALALGAGALALVGGAAGAASAQGQQSHPAPPLVAPRIGVNAPEGNGAQAVRGATKSFALNWSGYAQSTTHRGTFNAVRSFWRVPTVSTSSSGDQYSSDWVGIGGFSDNTLVQAGTEADNIGGTAKYDAWTEIIPAPAVVISGLVIKPGDKMEAVVKQTASGTWKMTVFDLTTGKSGGRTVKYKSSGKSAEAIHERPEVGGRLAPLAKTSNVTIDPGSFSTAAPGTLSWKPLLKTISGTTLNEIFMVNNSGTAVIASPSAADSDSDGFTVADGSTSPSPPAS
jgi:Peptidase A4 family